MVYWPMAKEVYFKDISNFALVAMINFGRRHHEVHFCKVILNLDQWFSRRGNLKIFLSIDLAAFLFSASR